MRLKAGMRIRILNPSGAGWLPKGCVRMVTNVEWDYKNKFYQIYTKGDGIYWAATSRDFQIIGIEPYYKALCSIK